MKWFTKQNCINIERNHAMKDKKRLEILLKLIKKFMMKILTYKS